MSDFLSNMMLGLATAATPFNLLMCFVGALLGTFVGVLPGIGPLATMAMLLPITFYLPPESALIMLAGIYYGAQYGSSTTSHAWADPVVFSSTATRWRCRAAQAGARHRARLLLRRLWSRR